MSNKHARADEQGQTVPKQLPCRHPGLAAHHVLITSGLYYSIDRNVVALAVLIVGVLGQAFAALIAWIGLLPLVGPMVAHVLSLPFIWLLNGLGYLVSIVAIRRGYSKDVLNYRIITVALLFGITFGYVLGKLV